MNGCKFYKLLTPDLEKACGLDIGQYDFYYNHSGHEVPLVKKGKNRVTLYELSGLWSVDDYGFILRKTVTIAHPDVLYGPSGIACKGAILGICIIWTCKKLSMTGCIYPERIDTNADEHIYVFNQGFTPGKITGDLELELIFYIKEKAKTASSDEKNIMNETGVFVGTVETFSLVFDDSFLDFPIEKVNNSNEPLWWLEIYGWDDPKMTDTFSKESFCVFINQAYDLCPKEKPDDALGMTNFDVMIDIISQVYFLLFMNLNPDDRNATKTGKDVEKGTICDVLHNLILDGIDLDPEGSVDKFQKNLQITVRNLLSMHEEE